MERKLKDRLQEESRYPDAMKDELWSRIEANLDQEAAAPRSARQHNKSRGITMKRIRITTGVAAAAVAVAVFLSMPTGTALMKDIKTWFAPEKKVEISIEGQTEETNQKLHQGGQAQENPNGGSGEAKKEASEYVIYYDQERYKLVEGQNKDIITTKEPLPDRYPDVSLTIAQYPEASPADMFAELEQQVQNNYADVKPAEQVAAPVSGYRIHALNGQEWNSEVTTVYVVSNGKQGSFVLTEKYFLEAAEGHGARFEQMLKEFRVLGGE